MMSLYAEQPMPFRPHESVTTGSRVGERYQVSESDLPPCRPLQLAEPSRFPPARCAGDGSSLREKLEALPGVGAVELAFDDGDGAAE